MLDSLTQPVDTSTALTFSLIDLSPGYGQRRRRRNLSQFFIDAQGDFIISNTSPECTSVSPTSLSPVISTNYLTFTLSDYTSTIVDTDFTVVMQNIADTSVRRTLSVTSFDDSAKTLTVKFPGAASGTYGFKISGK